MLFDRKSIQSRTVEIAMSFRVIALIGIAVTAAFGLAFVIAPEAVASLYGITGWSAGQLLIARLLGVELLSVAGALLAVRNTEDRSMQRVFAIALGAAGVLGALVTAQGVLAGATNALSWSTVLIYAFFALAWGRLVLARR
jgi:hypothetical protein